MDPRETADLERRVQAHEELLTALVVAVAKEHPAILTGLEGAFVAGAPSGEATQPSTLDHIAQILRIARRDVGAN
jgi:hypothetical protein